MPDSVLVVCDLDECRIGNSLIEESESSLLRQGTPRGARSASQKEQRISGNVSSSADPGAYNSSSGPSRNVYVGLESPVESAWLTFRVEPALVRFSELLAPGGVLVIVGLYRADGLTDAAFSVAGLIASQAKRRFHYFRETSAPIKEPQQTLKEIAKAAERLLPASHVRRRFYFRYSLVWQKPQK